ncbi:MAG: class I SAM-dependent methyltransferase [Pseudomonadales bacterium]|nr:class I SAM-dependent methyltransferase [Pseudomonadales bacterium]
MPYFLEIFGRLPRAGPGSTESTRRAYGLLSGVPKAPRILDIGCGPGVQTVDLLKISGGTVLALDFLPLMLERTRSSAMQAGVSERLEVLEQDMREMDFPSDSFDIIWSEGAIYNLGFEEGLVRVRGYVKAGGYVAVSEAVWLKPDPPRPVVDFWAEYPEIDTVENKRAVIERLGYGLEGWFILPELDWTANYYEPMEKLLVQKSEEWKDIPEALAAIENARHEISLYRQHSDYYGYAFFVMRRAAACERM